MKSVGQAHFNALLQLERKPAGLRYFLIAGNGANA
jgi:hypothetical protein